jgi:hypothetical protein
MRELIESRQKLSGLAGYGWSLMRTNVASLYKMKLGDWYF